MSRIITHVASASLVYCITTHYIRRRAWNNDVTTLPHPVSSESTLIGKRPGLDSRGVLQLLVHSHLYMFKAFYAMITFFPSLIISKEVCDEDIFNFCTETSLVLLMHYDKVSDTWTFSVQNKIIVEHVDGIDVGSLHIVFKDRRIVSTYTNQANYTNSKHINNRLIVCLRNLSATWIHPTIHLAAEYSALQIQEKRVDILEPCSHYVSSLHEGLLFNKHSPLSTSGFFYAGSGTPDLVKYNANSIIRHVYQPEKTQFRFYQFVVQTRKILRKLYDKYKLDVEFEPLYANLILHKKDHDQVHKCLVSLPLCSVDGTGSLRSYWSWHCFVQMWVDHWNNPFHSDYIKHQKNPFFQELYQALKDVDLPYAERAVASTCF